MKRSIITIFAFVMLIALLASVCTVEASATALDDMVNEYKSKRI